MPWSAVASVVGSLIGSADSPQVSGGGNGYYTPTGLGTADQAWQQQLQNQIFAQNGIQNNAGLYGQSLNQGLNANSLYSPGYQNSAVQAGQQYGNLGNLMGQQAASNYGQQQSLLGAGQNIYNMGLDPQNALYNRTLNQMQQQTGATNSMYGLGSSAAGAGVQNQALSNFNIDWQNQQLGRAAQGLGAYTGAANTAGNYAQLAGQQAASQPGYTLQGGQTPYNAAMGIAGAPGQLASTYATGLEQGPLASSAGIQGQAIPYMNYGAGAQATPFQSAQQNAAAQGALISNGISGIGNAIQNNGGFSNLFGGGATGSFSGGDFSGAFTNPSPYYNGGIGNAYGFTM